MQRRVEPVSVHAIHTRTTSCLVDCQSLRTYLSALFFARPRLSDTLMNPLTYAPIINPFMLSSECPSAFDKM